MGKRAEWKGWKRSRHEGVSPLWIRLFRKTPWMIKIQDTKNPYRKRSRQLCQRRSGSLRKPKEANPRADIQRAKSSTMLFPQNPRRKGKMKNKMATQIMRNRVGTPQ